MCAFIGQASEGIEARACLASPRDDAMLPATARRVLSVRIIMLVMQCASSRRKGGKGVRGRGHRACHTHTRGRGREIKSHKDLSLWHLWYLQTEEN